MMLGAGEWTAGKYKLKTGRRDAGGPRGAPAIRWICGLEACFSLTHAGQLSTFE